VSQKFAAYDANGNITGFYDDVDSPVPSGVNAIEITVEQWQACLSAPGGYVVTGGALVAAAAPTGAELLADAQALQVATLSEACAAAIVAGFTSSALGAVYTYPAKDTDQQNLASSVLSSLMPNLPSTWETPFWCADASGNWAFVAHTAAEIQQVGQDGKAAILACMQKNQTLAAEVQAVQLGDDATGATAVAAVQAITWS
jgi:hypothetical protein